MPSIAQDFGVNDQTIRNWLKETKEKQEKATAIYLGQKGKSMVY